MRILIFTVILCGLIGCASDPPPIKTYKITIINGSSKVEKWVRTSRSLHIQQRFNGTNEIYEGPFSLDNPIVFPYTSICYIEDVNE